MMPVFPFRTLLMLAIPAAIAAAILAVMSTGGTSVFKKQGVAWGLTVLMVFAAIGIGYAKAPANNPAPEPNLPSGTIPPDHGDSYHWEGGQYLLDNANVLSDKTLKALDQRNERLWDRHRAVIGVVTCNYGRDDLAEYAAKQFKAMGLGRNDMLVVLDISGSVCWLCTGDSVARKFTNQDSTDYVYKYVEPPFVRGDYDTAVLDLTERLEAWYGTYYGR